MLGIRFRNTYPISIQQILKITALSLLSGLVASLPGQAEPSETNDLPENSPSVELFSQDLLADPNPLSRPTLVEEVEIENVQVISLEEAIELAYTNNQDLQVALLDLEQSNAVLDEARAALSPTVDTSADVIFREDQGTIFEDGSGIETSLGSEIEINYDLFTSGSRRATIRAAEAQVRSDNLEVERTREELRLNTARLYYDLQEATEDIRINQAFVEEATQNLRDNQVRQQAGVGTQFDVLRAGVQLAEARQDLVQAQSDQQIAQRNLARLLNIPTTQNIQATAVVRAEDWSLTLEESILQAFENRVELEQSLEQREIVIQQSIVALSAVRPQIDLSANYSLSEIFDDGQDLSDFYSFSADLNWQLFDGGAAEANAQQQEIEAKIAEQTFSESLDTIRFNVEEAYFNLQANADSINTAQTAVTQAQESLNIANLRLDAGVGTELDVLAAQSELIDAEGNLVDALLGYNRALVEIQRAISSKRFVQS